MTALTTRVKVCSEDTISIRMPEDSELSQYPRTSWRKGFNHYLDAVWSQLNAEAEGVLFIGDIALSLTMRNGYCLLPNRKSMGLSPDRPIFARDQVHAVTCDRDPLELGLAKFVRNNHIQQLVIEFANARLMLWKGPERTDLFATVVDRTF